MVAALSSVDALEQPPSLVWLDAPLVDAGHAAIVQLIVDDGVALGATQYLSCLQFSLRKYVLREVVQVGLRPGRRLSPARLDGLVWPGG